MPASVPVRQAGPTGVGQGRLETRTALLDAVDELTAERGWSACSLQAVARRAGLTTGAVYSTFGSRGALLAASMVRRLASVAGLPAGHPDLRRSVSAYAGSYWAASGQAEGVSLVLSQLDLVRIGATDPSLATALHEAYGQLLAVLAEDLVRLGGDRLPAAPIETAQRMLGVLQGLAMQRIAFGAPISQRVFVDAALGAVGLPPGSGARIPRGSRAPVPPRPVGPESAS